MTKSKRVRSSSSSSSSSPPQSSMMEDDDDDDEKDTSEDTSLQDPMTRRLAQLSLQDDDSDKNTMTKKDKDDNDDDTRVVVIRPFAQLHWETCRNEFTMIIATPQQVFTTHPTIATQRPKRHEVLVWKTTTTKNHHHNNDNNNTTTTTTNFEDAWLDTLMVRIHEVTASSMTMPVTLTPPTVSSSSSTLYTVVVSTPIKLVKAAYDVVSPIFASTYQDDDHQDEDEYDQDDDEHIYKHTTTTNSPSRFASFLSGASNNNSSNKDNHDDPNKVRHDTNSTSIVQLHDAIVNIPLTAECYQVLQRQLIEHCHNHQQDASLHSIGGGIWTEHGSVENPFSWNAFVSSKTVVQERDATMWSFLTSLPRPQIQLFVALLQRQGHLRRIERTGQPTLYLYLDHPEDTTTAADIETRIAVFDLHYIHYTLEQQCRHWQDRSVYHQQRALQAHRTSSSNDTNATNNNHNKSGRRFVLTEYQRSKQCQKQVEQYHQQLLTLTQTLATLEQAKSNQAVLQVLGQTAETLRQVRVDNVDTVLDDLREETEHVQYMDETLASLVAASSSSALSMDDEDVLEQELWQLMEMDHTLTTTPPSTVPTSSSDLENTQTTNHSRMNSDNATPTDDNDDSKTESMVGDSTLLPS